MRFPKPGTTPKPLAEILGIIDAARCALGFHDAIQEVQMRHGHPVRIRETCRNCGNVTFTILVED